MMDYYGFWKGFVGLFVILPVVVGGAVSAFWALACSQLPC